MGLDIYFHKVRKAHKSSNEPLKTIKEYADILEKRAKDKFLRFSKKSVLRLANAADENEYKEIYHDIFNNQMKKYTKWDFSYEKFKNEVFPLDAVKKFFKDFLSRYYAEEDAYFRKVNFVYHYFSPKLVNECCFVTKYDMLDLVDRCDRVLKNHSLAEELLPTQSGFFFGSTDYNEYYLEDIKETKEKLESVINDIDFENENVYYLASW